MKFALCLLLLARSVAALVTHLPTIDLGYIQQRATEHSSTNGLYIYRNVRYASPPIGELRFRKPQPPLPEPVGTVSNGSQYKTTICSQGVTSSTPSTNGFSEDCLVRSIYLSCTRSY
jgi:carboxylesterase type B